MQQAENVRGGVRLECGCTRSTDVNFRSLDFRQHCYTLQYALLGSNVYSVRYEGTTGHVVARTTFHTSCNPVELSNVKSGPQR